MTKQDVYQDVTDRIVAELEAGVVPWAKPWKSIGGGLPVSLRSGKPYRGVNVFLLALESMKKGYSDPRWGTFKAIKEAGGSVRKGERGTKVILWKPVRGQHENEAGEKVGHQYLLLREYTVFNVQQADGIEPLPAPELREHDADADAEAIVAGYKLGPVVMYGGDRAFYSPATDHIGMPTPEQFTSSDAFYGTLFHELVHSTGHESRLDRLEPALFGSDPYAKEELVAELGSAMLAGLAGLESAGGQESAAYIGGWLRKLKDDRKLVVQAAAAAQRAADRIVGDTFDGELELEGGSAPELEPALAAAAA